jgi:thiol-disulfide isomerase/thioredoxin
MAKLTITASNIVIVFIILIVITICVMLFFIFYHYLTGKFVTELLPDTLKEFIASKSGYVEEDEDEDEETAAAAATAAAAVDSTAALLASASETEETEGESFSNKKQLKNNLKNLDVVYIKMDSCPYCKKMDEFLKKNNYINDVKSVDVNTEIGRKLTNKYKINGFPALVSLKTNKSMSGYTNNINNIITSLSQYKIPSKSNNIMENYKSKDYVKKPLKNNLKNLNVVYIKMDSCPYCKKMDEFLKKNNYINDVKSVDVNTDIGRKLTNKYKINGFPALVSLKTNKSMTGYTDNIDNIITSLS